MIVRVQWKKINAVLLAGELGAAGVAPMPGTISPFRRSGDQLEVEVADGSDALVVVQVVERHVYSPGPGPEATTRAHLKARVAGGGDAEVLLRAAARALVQLDAEHRGWEKDLLAALKAAGVTLTLAPPPVRTWAQFANYVSSQIDVEVPLPVAAAAAKPRKKKA